MSLRTPRFETYVSLVLGVQCASPNNIYKDRVEEHPPQRRRFESTRPPLVFGLSLSLSAPAKILPAWGSLHSSSKGKEGHQATP